MKKIVGTLMIGIGLISFLCAVTFAATAPTKVEPIGPKEMKIQKPVLCSDLVATLSVTKTISGGNGIITLSGQVCNAGPGDYIGKDPLDTYFMVYTWHPPKTPAQESDIKFFGHTSIGTTLKKGECRSVRQTYTIPGVVQWGFDTLTPTKPVQRQAVKQFVLAVEKKYPMQAGDVSFSKCEDSNLDNSRGVVNVEYMEKVP